MNLDIAIIPVGVGVGDTGVTLSLSIAASDGRQLGADITVPFASSSTQINQAITDRVKAIYAGLGRPITASDRIKLFGGAV